MTAPVPCPPALQLTQFIENFWASRALWAAAKLAVADHLVDGPKSAGTLAEATGTHAPSLVRLLRALCGLGIFLEDEQGRFGLTPTSELMRSDVENSLRPTLISELGEVHYPAWGGLMHSLRSGERAFDQVLGCDVWTYFNQHPDVGGVFHRSMTSLTKALDAAVLQAYDFGRFKKILDVGGGHGGLLSAILARNPRQVGVVFDQPQVVAGARDFLAGAGLAPRCDAVGGDFFTAIPVTGADACVMKFILHDWTDEQSLTILRNCHRALPAGATLLLLETVLPPRNETSFGKFMDLNMLVMTGGRERTADEFSKLLSEGGFEMRNVLATESLICVIEAQRI